jgi:hypothetical protein
MVTLYCSSGIFLLLLLRIVEMPGDDDVCQMREAFYCD